jgi:predicted lipid-binding transport protein (Tim44 family)
VASSVAPSVEDPEVERPATDLDQARNAAMAAWQAHKVSTMIERISNPETAHVVTLLKKETPESDARAAYAEAGGGFGEKPAARERQASQTP